MLLALLVSTVLVLAAPFIGEFRRWLAATLPGQYVWIINGIVGAAAVAVVLAALVRIRQGRLWRFGQLGLATAVAIGFTRATGSSVPAVAAVEHFHFVQYGVITSLFYRAWRTRGDAASLVLPATAAFVFGVAEEWWQWFLPARVGELHDVLLNTVAIACGLLVSAALAPLPVSSRGRGRGVPASAAGLMSAAAAAAAFTWTVHTGYSIHDEEIGTFRSRYSAGQLRVIAAERAATWAIHPPPGKAHTRAGGSVPFRR